MKHPWNLSIVYVKVCTSICIYIVLNLYLQQTPLIASSVSRECGNVAIFFWKVSRVFFFPHKPGSLRTWRSQNVGGPEFFLPTEGGFLATKVVRCRKRISTFSTRTSFWFTSLACSSSSSVTWSWFWTEGRGAIGITCKARDLWILCLDNVCVKCVWFLSWVFSTFWSWRWFDLSLDFF